MPLAGQINSLAITGAVFHKDGCVILTMTVVITLMNKDAPQVGTSGHKEKKYFFLVLCSFSVAFGNFSQLL